MANAKRKVAHKTTTHHKVAHRGKAKSRVGTLGKVAGFLALPIPDVELAVAAMANPDSGIKFVLGIAKKAGKRVSAVQSVLFDRMKWTANAASQWLKDHGFTSGGKDEGATFWRFRQQSPGKYKEFRTIVPGARQNPRYESHVSGWERAIQTMTPKQAERALVQTEEYLRGTNLSPAQRVLLGENAAALRRRVYGEGRENPTPCPKVYRTRKEAEDAWYDSSPGRNDHAKYVKVRGGYKIVPEGPLGGRGHYGTTVDDMERGDTGFENPEGEGSSYAILDGVRVGLGTDNVIIFSTDWDYLWKLAAKGDHRLVKQSGGPGTYGHTSLFYVGRDVKEYPSYEEENPTSSWLKRIQELTPRQAKLELQRVEEHLRSPRLSPAQRAIMGETARELRGRLFRPGEGEEMWANPTPGDSLYLGTNNSDQKLILTTNHAASSHGIPVLVVDGVALGPKDDLPLREGEVWPWLGTDPAHVAVSSAARKKGLLNHRLVQLFLAQRYLENPTPGDSIKVKQYKGTLRGILTTNHAASSYGQPVLVVHGKAYGPGDDIPGDNGNNWIPEDPHASGEDNRAVQAWQQSQMSAYLRTLPNPTPGDSIDAYDEHLATTMDPEFQAATPDEQAAAMTVQDATEGEGYFGMGGPQGGEENPVPHAPGGHAEGNPYYAWAVQEESVISGWHTVSTWITHEAANKMARELAAETGKTHRVMHKDSGRVYQTFKGSREENPRPIVHWGKPKPPSEPLAKYQQGTVFAEVHPGTFNGEPGYDSFRSDGNIGWDPTLEGAKEAAAEFVERWGPNAPWRQRRGNPDSSAVLYKVMVKEGRYWVTRETNLPLRMASDIAQGIQRGHGGFGSGTEAKVVPMRKGNPESTEQELARIEASKPELETMAGYLESRGFKGQVGGGGSIYYYDHPISSSIGSVALFDDGGWTVHYGSGRASKSTMGRGLEELKAAVSQFRNLKRGNPESSAAALYEDFHGKPPAETKEIITEVRDHEWLTQLGALVELKVATVTKLDAIISFEKDAPDLCSSEDGRQLYIEGGDQALDLSGIKMGGDKWLKDSMVIGVLYELTYSTKKGFHKFRTTDYFHKLGEETGEQPTLLYDPNNKLLSVSGGQYQTKDVGIVN